VHPLLDAVVDYLPSPLDVPPVHGVKPGTEEVIVLLPQDNAPLGALAFKVQMDEGRKAVYLRIYSGVIKAGQEVLNPRTGRKEKVARLFAVHANRREKLEKAGAGEIVLAMGLRDAGTGDTICSPEHPVLLERIGIQDPVLGLAVEPKTQAEKEKLEFGLSKLADEDPTFRYGDDAETGQTIIRGMGELHLDILVDRLRREYGVEVNVGRPQVVCRETLAGAGEGEARFEREVEGQKLFGHAVIRVGPRARGSGNLLRLALPPPTAIAGGKVLEIPSALVAATMDGARESMTSGLQGDPLEDVEVALCGIEYHPESSGIPGQKAAVAEALRKAFRSVGTKLLEPIMRVEVTSPEASVGDVLGDLNQRRAQVEDVGFRGNQRIVLCKVPLRRMFGYSTDLRSATQGRASFSMHFDRYDTWD